jgi:hypothetical protein
LVVHLVPLAGAVPVPGLAVLLLAGVAVAAALAVPLAADDGVLLPDALAGPDPLDEHPASAPAVTAAVAQTPETSLILFTRIAPIASVTRGSVTL